MPKRKPPDYIIERTDLHFGWPIWGTFSKAETEALTAAAHHRVQINIYELIDGAEHLHATVTP